MTNSINRTAIIAIATGIILAMSARYGARPRRERIRSYVAIAACPPSNGSTGNMLSNPTNTLTAASVSSRPPKPVSSPIVELSLLMPTTVVGRVLRSSLEPVRWPMMLTGLSTFTTPPMLCHTVGRGR